MFPFSSRFAGSFVMMRSLSVAGKKRKEKGKKKRSFRERRGKKGGGGQGKASFIQRPVFCLSSVGDGPYSVAGLAPPGWGEEGGKRKKKKVRAKEGGRGGGNR